LPGSPQGDTGPVVTGAQDTIDLGRDATSRNRMR
jgi:hypothetical protein